MIHRASIRVRHFLALVLFASAAAVVTAHPLNWTKLRVDYDATGTELVAYLEVDLANFVGGYSRYRTLVEDPARESVLQTAARDAMNEIHVRHGGRPVRWVMDEFVPPPLDDEFFAPLPAPMAFARFRASADATDVAALDLAVAGGTRLELPVVVRAKTQGDVLLLLAAQPPARLALTPVSMTQDSASLASTPTPRRASREVAGQFLSLGFIHILPLGVDHILFVLGLFFAGGRGRDLLLQVSAFTLAHTCTLAAATLGWVAVPGRFVEPLIAVSIIWLAWENFRGHPASLRRRLPLVFAFGLLHGLGFAGALAALGLPDGQRLMALVSFNVGVELGQLTVLALAFLLVGWWRERPRYRTALVQPASVAMALVAGWWTLERTFA